MDAGSIVSADRLIAMRTSEFQPANTLWQSPLKTIYWTLNPRCWQDVVERWAKGCTLRRKRNPGYIMRINRSKKRKAKGHSPRSSGEAARFESLESRMLLTGTWTPLLHAAPSGIGTMMLLPDGTVLSTD